MEACISLKQYRKRVLKIEQHAIAEAAGVSQSRVSHVENGLTPPEEHVPALAAAYGISVDEFWRLFNRKALGGATDGNGTQHPAVAGVVADAGGTLSDAGSMAGSGAGAHAEAGR